MNSSIVFILRVKTVLLMIQLINGHNQNRTSIPQAVVAVSENVPKYSPEREKDLDVHKMMEEDKRIHTLLNATLGRTSIKTDPFADINGTFQTGSLLLNFSDRGILEDLGINVESHLNSLLLNSFKTKDDREQIRWYVAAEMEKKRLDVASRELSLKEVNDAHRRDLEIRQFLLSQEKFKMESERHKIQLEQRSLLIKMLQKNIEET